MPSSVSRKTKATGYKKSQKGMKQLQTVMNVLILIFCDILKLLVSWVGRNNKIYELDTTFNRVYQKREHKDTPVL